MSNEQPKQHTKTHTRPPSLLFLLLVLLSLLVAPGAVSAAGPDVQKGPESSAVELESPEELEAFFDGAVAAQLAAYPVAGMSVSVVKDGEILFAKGYGYADVEAQVPVAADETLFRVASLSKLFVWTAIMQLVEAGRLDLDADVNTYLDFQIPEAYGEPITLRHLMTHTPGFEDRALGLFLPTEEQVDPLAEHLAQNVPERVFPPGEIIAYSNYGAALAGYIVQRVSDMPFFQYAEEKIFNPLGMAQSTFRQPLPPELAANLSQGYSYQQGRFEEGTFEFIPLYPAGALSATATDMAAFMIAHLQHGRYRDARILQEESARQMRQLAFAQDPRAGGWGLGFAVAEMDGLDVVGHNGATTFFHSQLLLLPEGNVGLFISSNTDRGAVARSRLMHAFLERYYVGGELERPAIPQEFEQRAQRYTGTYFPSRMNFSSIEKLGSLAQPLQVQATGEGELAVSGLLGAEPTYWVERSPNLFAPASENLPASAKLVFQPEEGSAEPIEYALFQQLVYIKQPAYASQGFHFTLVGISALFFLVMLVAVPVGALVHRRYRQAAPALIRPNPAGARVARWLTWLFALLNLVFVIVVFVTLSDLAAVAFGLPGYLEALLVVPWISALLFLAIAAFAILSWIRRYWTLWGRIFYTLFTLVVAGYLWFLWFWNLL